MSANALLTPTALPTPGPALDRTRLLRTLPTYLIYATVLVRTAAWYEMEQSRVQPVVVGMLAVYGLALISAPFITRRWPRYPIGYLLLQSALILALMLETPGMDFIPALFLPLSFQAVQFFKRRLGFLWIGVFLLALTGPLLIGWDWELPGVASVLIHGSVCYIVGNYAHLIDRAGQSRRENQRLLAELEGAYRQLQGYAAQVEEYAAAQERSRLARELHDSVTQTLFSMNLVVQSTRLLIDQAPSQVPAQLDRLEELAQHAAAEIKILTREFHPRPLAEAGLAAGLARLAAERLRRDGLTIDLQVQGGELDQSLPEPVASGLYRIAQEALNNVAKHSGACEATLRLDLAARPPFLEVEDWGAGFEPGEITPNIDHIGLAGMAERSREIGWSFKVDSAPGRGTRIRVEEASHG